MAEQMRPASREEAPDPSNNYERAHPGREAGMGRLDNNRNAVPTDAPDKMEEAVPNRQDGGKQINAHETGNQRTDFQPGAGQPSQSQPDHSMKDEEPMGWDQAPLDIHDPRRQRQPRTEGKGGTP